MWIAERERIMMRSAYVFLVCLIVLMPRPAQAAATLVNCTVNNMAQGVASDGDTNYSNGYKTRYVKCYLGVGGGNFNLATYNSGRTFQFSFAPGADLAAAELAGLPSTSFRAEVDAFGTNYWGKYLNMGLGTTAQVQLDLNFHYGPPNASMTYELNYSCLTVTRVFVNTWVITSRTDLGLGNQYAVPCVSSKATLSRFRRNSAQSYGEVHMPIHIEFSPQ